VLLTAIASFSFMQVSVPSDATILSTHRIKLRWIDGWRRILAVLSQYSSVAA